MLLTVPIKLSTTKEQKELLLKTLYVCNTACDFVSKFCFTNKQFGLTKTHSANYLTIKSKFDLPAQLAIRCIGKVLDSYKTDKTVLHKFRNDGAVDLDARSLTWKKNDIVSILTLSGRIKIAFQSQPWMKLAEREKRNSAKLIYKKGEFYLFVPVEVVEDPIQQPNGFLGVDLGIVNLATTSIGETYSGSQADIVRERYSKLKAGLQKTGTKSAKRHLKKISGKERNFKKNTNHVISKQIVQGAKALGTGIALEELKGFKKTVSRKQRERFGKWAFGELAAFICYKAAIAGVWVEKVDPRNTSRECSECGFCDKKNRKNQSKFVCICCNFEANADINAAINIAARASLNMPIAAGNQIPSSNPTVLTVGI